MSRHTLSVLVENKPGVLARVAALFSRRGFNIDSLAVGPTERPEISRMTIQPKGKSRSNEPPPENIPPKISMLIQADTIYLGVSSAPIDPVVAKKENGEYEWSKITGQLEVLRKEPTFDGIKDIEIAAESTPQAKVAYKDIIHAMDLAAKAGFDGVGLSEPTSLSWRPSL